MFPNRGDLATAGRGVLMGGADIIPGVSGGTVALIVGIYERLVVAISHVDRDFVAHVFRCRFRAAAEHIDLRFLLTLLAGIFTGVLSLASLMHWLLEDQEHVSIHSVAEDGKQVILNVGTGNGGISERTALDVWRAKPTAERPPSPRHPYERIARLRLERYSNDDAGGIRQAVAVRTGDEGVQLRPDDLVTGPSRRRTPTLGLFFGLILASSVLVARMIERHSGTTWLGLFVGAAFAYWLVGRLPAAPPSGYTYLVLCGALAICAMILPGISGAFILLLLGTYSTATGSLRNLMHGSDVLGSLAVMGSLGFGAAVGLLAFSKMLRWMLQHHHAATMAVLCGFMLGSLRRIWPFKSDLTPQIARANHKHFANVWPQSWSQTEWLAVAMAAAGVAVVLLLERVGRRREETAIEGAGSDGGESGSEI